MRLRVPFTVITILFLLGCSFPLGISAEDTAYLSQDGSIQDAIDALGSEGGTIFLSAGTYTITDTVEIFSKSNISIIGEGAENTILDASGTMEDVIHINGSRGITLSNIQVRGGENGIRAYDSSITISKTVITGNSIDGILCKISNASASASVFNVAIQDSILSHNGDEAIHYVNDSTDRSCFITIKNNILSDNGGEGVLCWTNYHIPMNRTDIKVVNNTIVNNMTKGIFIVCNTGSNVCDIDALIANNIIVNNAQGISMGQYYESTYIGDIVVSSLAITNNDVWSNPDVVAGSGICPNSDYENMTSYEGIDGNISSDPLFVNYSAQDYRLLPISPCIDTGFDAFDDEYGSVRSDIEGIARPMGMGYEMGAYETGVSETLAPGDSIQASIDALDQGGAVIYLSSGRYLLSQTLLLEDKRSISIIGAGSESTIIDAGELSYNVINIINSENIEISNCRIIGGENGIYARNSSCIFSNNTIENNAVDGMICKLGSEYAENSTIEICIQNSIISHNGDEAIHFVNDSYGRKCDITIKNNILSDNGGEGVLCWSNYHNSMNTTDIKIVNNTIVNNESKGILIVGYTSQCTYKINAIIANNIIAYNACGISMERQDVESNVYELDISSLEVKCNDVWSNQDVVAGGAIGVNVDYANMTSYEGIDGNISSDPQMKSYMTGNYHLGSSSPCIDAGMNTSGSKYGSVITDIAGLARPLYEGYDIGAYEYECCYSQWSPGSLRPIASALMEKVIIQWDYVVGSYTEFSEEAQDMIDEAQVFISNASSLSNPIFVAGMLQKAIELLELIQ